MMNKQHWSVAELRKLLPALSHYATPAYEEIQEAAGELEGFDLYFVEVATLLGPEAIGVAHIYKRAPYANPDGHRERIESTLSRGWLERSGDSGYVDSEKGSDLYMKYIQAYKERFAEVESLPAIDLQRLSALLDVVISVAEQYTDVLDKPALQLSLSEIIDDDTSTLQKILTQAIQLLAYRDDAHVASWSPHKIDGITWEALSDIWAGEISTSEELVEKRPGRQYTKEDYESALKELARKGWTKNIEGAYTLTEEGRRVREEAEELTNDYYDAPWTILNDAEDYEAQGLIAKLIEMHEPEPQPA